MALIQVNYVSKALLRTVTINVILPVDKFYAKEEPAGTQKKFKTLYLLHGIFGNYTDWVSGTRIQRWAEAKDLAVVMPSGENGFYLDQKETGNFYADFVGRELVEMTRKMFPLSDKREDTFIGGLSMGGYGAIRNGLYYQDTFGAIAGLSSAVHLLENPQKKPQKKPRRIAFELSMFGDLEEAAKTDKNPRLLIEKLAKERPDDLPKIFMACGTEDGLLEANRAYRDYFRNNGYDLTYCESQGGHDWDFWDQYIKKVIDWLPLDDGKQGVNSGNVEG